MPRVRIPHNVPVEGEPMDLVEGPADGKVVPYTGLTVDFAEGVDQRNVFDPSQPFDPTYAKRIYRYRLREIAHILTGEKRWVYWYES